MSLSSMFGKSPKSFFRQCSPANGSTLAGKRMSVGSGVFAKVALWSWHGKIMLNDLVIIVNIKKFSAIMAENRSGKYNSAAEKLLALIPDEGAVKNPRKNVKLEKFRKAVNCYYDLYNNGLCNRARQFSALFNITPSIYRLEKRYRYSPLLYILVETKMDDIIEAAAIEQGIELITQMELELVA